MSTHSNTSVDLEALARQTMMDKGFEPDFPPSSREQLQEITEHPPSPMTSAATDLRHLLWSSIDNDTSRDLDQIEWAEQKADGSFRVLIGVADVDALVAKDTPIDEHAAEQTTTVYTGVRMFPMLPEELSTGLTSLNENADRAAMVMDFGVTVEGHLGEFSVYPAVVRNKAQLAYNAVGAWLEGRGPAPAKVAADPDLQKQLQLQSKIAQALKAERFRHGALALESLETSPVTHNGEIISVENHQRNLATDLIEDFMIAANEVVARTLHDRKVSSIRRIVKTPERWNRIVELAASKGAKLPADPDSKALNDFLSAQRAADPDHFPDLSLAVVKLMGPGEYVLERANDTAQGHFGLAVQDYTHSTAPNRRFADLVTHRILKATASGGSNPYSDADLDRIAQNCTEKEDAARKVQRIMQKRIAAVAMQHRIGDKFDAIVTGVTPKGTFVRTLEPHAEGILVNPHGADVGDRMNVKLISADPQRGYIDFTRL